VSGPDAGDAVAAPAPEASDPLPDALPDGPAEDGLAEDDTIEVIAKRGGWSRRDRELERVLLAELAGLDPQDPRRRVVRDELVTMHLALVEHLARRFRDRGEPHEDLVQVGTIGLIKAVDRFDLDRGVEFSTYATPTIVGEIKRHFRDRGWAIRVPRRLQEMRLMLNRATAELTQQLGRAPTVAELAAHLGVTQDEVLEGLDSAQAYATSPLDAGGGDDGGDGGSVLATLGELDAELEGVENREALKPLLAALPEREQRILVLRFFHNKTQSQIAQEVGLSQMHVSRLLAKTLAALRTQMLDDY
jgi:RNA polymerase sigma-B factor